MTGDIEMRADGRMVLVVGNAEPFDRQLLNRLPGTRVRWAIGPGGLDDAIGRTEPGELIIQVDDLAAADRWYFALLDAAGTPPPWLRRKPRARQ